VSFLANDSVILVGLPQIKCFPTGLSAVLMRPVLTPFVQSLRPAAFRAHHDISPSALRSMNLWPSGAVVVPDCVPCALHVLMLGGIVYKGFGHSHARIRTL
jgi:hypothetical protein